MKHIVHSTLQKKEILQKCTEDFITANILKASQFQWNNCISYLKAIIEIDFFANM